MGAFEDEIDHIDIQSGLDTMNSIWHFTAPLSQLASLYDMNNFLSAPQQPSVTVRRGDIINILGGPGSGKTFLLYSFAIASVIPPDLQFPSNSFKGWGKPVIVLDCDERWDATQFRLLLMRHLHTCEQVVRSCESSFEKLVSRCLQRVHIFRPSSPLSLICTLRSLESYYRDHLSSEDIGAILLDSAATFRWETKYMAECSDHRHARLATAFSQLESLRIRYMPLLVITDRTSANQKFVFLNFLSLTNASPTVDLRYNQLDWDSAKMQTKFTQITLCRRSQS